jgi:hypothetical protein
MSIWRDGANPRRRAPLGVCGLILGLVLAVHGAAAAQPQPKAMTNDDVVALVQAGLPAEVVIEKIKSSKTAFDTSTDALVALKKAGVGAEVIRVMINPQAAARDDTRRPGGGGGGGGQGSPCQLPPGGGPPAWVSGAAPAVWSVDPDRGARVAIEYERGSFQHVGFGPFGSRLLVLHPIRSQLRVSARTVFLSCINPTDAPLVHFSLDKDSDERNTSVGKITPFHVSFEISEDDLVAFKSEKTPDGYFKITVDRPMEAGEYGFVALESIGYFAAGDRVYTFGVD